MARILNNPPGAQAGMAEASCYKNLSGRSTSVRWFFGVSSFHVGLDVLRAKPDVCWRLAGELVIRSVS
jgi:hypothetical protein